MNPNREEALFAAALEQPSSERAAFLKGACLGDEALRKRVEDQIPAGPGRELAGHRGFEVQACLHRATVTPRSSLRQPAFP